MYASDISFVCRKCILLISATLDTGGWLGLTRQGLSPCKRCQALPGALAIAKSNDLFTTRHPGESRVLRGTGSRSPASRIEIPPAAGLNSGFRRNDGVSYPQSDKTFGNGYKRSVVPIGTKPCWCSSRSG